MAVTFTNNWKNITDQLQNKLRSEFGNTLPVFVGEDDYAGSQFLKILPVANEMIERVVSAELRQYNYNVILYMFVSNSPNATLINMLRILSRIESLVGNSRTMTLADGTTSINGELASYEIAEDLDNTQYVVEMDYMCHHLGNIS